MSLDRRTFLKTATVLGAAAFAPRVVAQPRFSAYPFTLGVASGFPHASGVTLWTRLAPRPLAGGGMPREPVTVRWEVAHDDAFRSIATNGTASAVAADGHSLHIEVEGLQPSRTYWYRFAAGDAVSPTGRTRTAPAADTPTQRLAFAVASCQQYEQGYYVAYRHMAREPLDLVVHVGDYIYEASWGRQHVRAHGAPDPFTLDEYRNRHALYKSDPDLQAAHAAFPWLVTWDDHEVQNDYANDRSEDLLPREVFLERRAAAYQAYYEHMPLPAWARPRGSAMRLYSSAAFGDLAHFCVLDDRQFRSHQACAAAGRGGSTVVRDDACPERRDPARTMLGETQERWLADTLGRSRARWNVIAQQTLMAQVARPGDAGVGYWTDGWDGYPAARQRLLEAARRVTNPLVVGGDLHMATVADLKTDFNDPASPVVATELLCPSITSQGPSARRTDAIVRENPHIRFANGTRHGYATVELTPRSCVLRMRTVGTVKEQNASIGDLAVFAVEEGRPGAQRA